MLPAGPTTIISFELNAAADFQFILGRYIFEKRLHVLPLSVDLITIPLPAANIVDDRTSTAFRSALVPDGICCQLKPPSVLLNTVPPAPTTIAVPEYSSAPNRCCVVPLGTVFQLAPRFVERMITPLLPAATKGTGPVTQFKFCAVPLDAADQLSPPFEV